MLFLQIGVMAQRARPAYARLIWLYFAHPDFRT